MKRIMTNSVIKNMVCTLALLLPLQFGTGIMLSEPKTSASDASVITGYNVPVYNRTRVVLLDLKREYCDTKCFLTQNIETVEFLSKTFGVDKNIVVENLIDINSTSGYIENNIGRITDESGELKDYGSFEKGLIEYLFIFAKSNPSLINNTRNPYNGGADYVVNLIKYFTQIYDNVDYLTAVSIGAAESGYYEVKYMLNCNNVFGGMGNNGLIKYKNIEYGVLSFIRLLSLNYYEKGLNTLETIGRVYCPTYENGVKVASAHWINLVNKAKNYYSDTNNEITVFDLIED